MSLIVLGIIAALVVVVAVAVVAHLVAVRAHEVVEVNVWFSEQMSIYQPQPLTPEYAAVICSIMDDDSDLWWQLGCGHDTVDHEPYHQQVIGFGRYLHVFGPLGAYQSLYCPSLYTVSLKVVAGRCFWPGSNFAIRMKLSGCSPKKLIYPRSFVSVIFGLVIPVSPCAIQSISCTTDWTPTLSASSTSVAESWNGHANSLLFLY